jgi:hypothetical protein
MNGEKMTDVPDHARPAFQATVMKEMREAENVPSPGALPWAKTSFSQEYQQRSLAAFFCDNPLEAAKTILELAGSLKPDTEFFLGTFDTTKNRWLRNRGGLVEAVIQFLTEGPAYVGGSSEEFFIPKGSSLSLHKIPHGQFQLDGQRTPPAKHKRDQTQPKTSWRSPREYAQGAGGSLADDRAPVDPVLFWDACASLQSGTASGGTPWSRVDGQADSAGKHDFYVKSPAISQWADKTQGDRNDDQPFSDYFVGLLHAFGSSWGVVHMSHCAVVILAGFLLRHENFRQYQEELNAPPVTVASMHQDDNPAKGVRTWHDLTVNRHGRGYKADGLEKGIEPPTHAAGVLEQPMLNALTNMALSPEQVNAFMRVLQQLVTAPQEVGKPP